MTKLLSIFQYILWWQPPGRCTSAGADWLLVLGRAIRSLLQVLLGCKVIEMATRSTAPGIEIPGWKVSATPAVLWTAHRKNDRVQRTPGAASQPGTSVPGRMRARLPRSQVARREPRPPQRR